MYNWTERRKTPEKHLIDLDNLDSYFWGLLELIETDLKVTLEARVARLMQGPTLVVDIECERDRMNLLPYVRRIQGALLMLKELMVNYDNDYETVAVMFRQWYAIRANKATARKEAAVGAAM